MKDSFKDLKINANFLFFDYRFKIIIMVMLCFNFFGVFFLTYNTSNSYIDSMISIIFNLLYLFGLLLIFFLNTINVFKLFEKNIYYNIRMESRKKYLSKLIKNIVLSNTILFVINFMILFIGLNIHIGNKLVFTPYMDYSINNIEYLFFHIIRMLFLINILFVVIVLLLKLINERFVFTLTMFVLASLYFSPFLYDKVIYSITNMHWNFCEYFRQNIYSAFSIEVSCSIVYVIILMIISSIIFFIVENKMKSVGE